MPGATGERQLRFWDKFRAHLKENNSPLQPLGEPLPLSWHAFKVTRSTERMEAVINSRGVMRVELYLTGKDALRTFSLLEQMSKDEPTKLSDQLVWEPLPGRILKKVYIETSATLEDEGKWMQQFEWLKNTLEGMHAYFEPRLRVVSKQ